MKINMVVDDDNKRVKQYIAIDCLINGIHDVTINIIITGKVGRNSIIIVVDSKKYDLVNDEKLFLNYVFKNIFCFNDYIIEKIHKENKSLRYVREDVVISVELYRMSQDDIENMWAQTDSYYRWATTGNIDEH